MYHIPKVLSIVFNKIWLKLAKIIYKNFFKNKKKTPASNSMLLAGVKGGQFGDLSYGKGLGQDREPTDECAY